MTTEETTTRCQINDKRYTDAFWGEGRKVVKVGVQFDIESWTILVWKVADTH